MNALSTTLVARLLASLALCVMGLCACTTTTTERTQVVPWLKDNANAGTITQITRPWGFEYKYQDVSGHILRVENRDQGRQLLSITEFQYDGAGRVIEERHFDSAENMRLTPDGFAIRRFVYSSDEDRNAVTEIAYFDTNGKPVAMQSGFAVLRQTFQANGRVRKLDFLDASREPTPSTWLGVANIVEVQYSYLAGVTEVTYAAFLDASGRVVERKQLSGLTSAYSSYANTTYYYPTYYYRH
ncbi:MAG: hypothetical protein ABSH14_01675 [Verrucomicrobiia bacterium]|jgi:YD repeat-containing protein